MRCGSGRLLTQSFNASRFHFNFRWFWDYAGGLMTDWGVHLLDYGLLGMNCRCRRSVSALGGSFAYPDLAEETPDTLTTLYEFDGFNMVWDHGMGIDNGSYNRDHGIAYIGNDATLVLNRNGWEVMEEKGSKQKVSRALAPVSDNGVDKHWENFIASVRSRKRRCCIVRSGMPRMWQRSPRWGIFLFGAGSGLAGIGRPGNSRMTGSTGNT